MRIYALLSVKFSGLKMYECKKMTNIRYGQLNESKLFPINSVSSLFLRHPVYIQFICVQPESCDSEKFALLSAVLDQHTEDKSRNLKNRTFVEQRCLNTLVVALTF